MSAAIHHVYIDGVAIIVGSTYTRHRRNVRQGLGSWCLFAEEQMGERSGHGLVPSCNGCRNSFRDNHGGVRINCGSQVGYTSWHHRTDPVLCSVVCLVSQKRDRFFTDYLQGENTCRATFSQRDFNCVRARLKFPSYARIFVVIRIPVVVLGNNQSVFYQSDEAIPPVRTCVYGYVRIFSEFKLVQLGI